MNSSDFKLWFEAFTENIEYPSRSQWDKIKDTLAKINDGNSFTEEELIERYFRATTVHGLGDSDYYLSK